MMVIRTTVDVTERCAEHGLTVDEFLAQGAERELCEELQELWRMISPLYRERKWQA